MLQKILIMLQINAFFNSFHQRFVKKMYSGFQKNIKQLNYFLHW